jgi:hypothetical protein
MSTEQVLRVIEIVSWPTVALVTVLVIRPHLSVLFSGAKVKLSIGGQSIETTLPELKQILEEQAGAALTVKHIEFLVLLQRDGSKQYPSGVGESEYRKFLRPLRNSGLILTVPRDSFLSKAQAIELSGLGRLFLRVRQQN